MNLNSSPFTGKSHPFGFARQDAGTGTGTQPPAGEPPIEADKLNRASPEQARKSIKDIVNSLGFEAAFQSGDVRGWPVAVLPNDVAQALRKQGLKPPGQIVVDGIEPRKLHKKHKKVGVEQCQTLQRALDQGGVYLEAPVKWRKAPSLLAEYQDDKGRWWFYAINLKTYAQEPSLTRGKQHRAKKLTEIKVIREWDPHRWRKSELWSLVGRAVPHVADESIARRRTWLRLHNRNHSPMNPRCQAFFDPRANKAAQPALNRLPIRE